MAPQETTTTSAVNSSARAVALRDTSRISRPDASVYEPFHLGVGQQFDIRILQGWIHAKHLRVRLCVHQARDGRRTCCSGYICLIAGSSRPA